MFSFDHFWQIFLFTYVKAYLCVRQHLHMVRSHASTVHSTDSLWDSYNDAYLRNMQKIYSSGNATTLHCERNSKHMFHEDCIFGLFQTGTAPLDFFTLYAESFQTSSRIIHHDDSGSLIGAAASSTTDKMDSLRMLMSSTLLFYTSVKDDQYWDQADCLPQSKHSNHP